MQRFEIAEVMDFLKNIFDPFHQRLKSQLYSALFVSWCLCNWRILVAIFTDAANFSNGPQKLEYIALLFDLSSNFCKLIILPILFATVYLFLFPLGDKLVFQYKNRIERSKKAKQLRLIKKTGATTQEYLSLYFKYEKLSNKINDVTSYLREKEITLKTRLEQTENIENELRACKKDRERLNEELKHHSFRNSISEFFKQNWILVMHYSDGREMPELDIAFQSNAILLNSAAENRQLAEILYFDFNPSSGNICFLLKKFQLRQVEVPSCYIVLNDYSNDDRYKYTGHINFLGHHQPVHEKIILSKRK